MTIPVEYREYKAGNPQVEREQRNKIFDDIRRKFAELGVEAGRDYITLNELNEILNSRTTPPGVEEFIELNDTPNSYAGAGGRYVRVTAVADGLEFRTAAQTLGDIGAVPEARQINAGLGLTGGGDLSADRTFNLADTAVTPGTYGSASTFLTATVDQQGRLTNLDTGGFIAIDAGQVVSGTFPSTVYASDTIPINALQSSTLTSAKTFTLNQLLTFTGTQPLNLDTGLRLNTSTISSTTNLAITDCVVSASNTITLTLPAASDGEISGQTYFIRNNNAAGNVTIGRNGATINGSAADLILAPGDTTIIVCTVAGLGGGQWRTFN